MLGEYLGGHAASSAGSHSEDVISFRLHPRSLFGIAVPVRVLASFPMPHHLLALIIQFVAQPYFGRVVSKHDALAEVKTEWWCSSPPRCSTQARPLRKARCTSGVSSERTRSICSCVLAWRAPGVSVCGRISSTSVATSSSSSAEKNFGLYVLTCAASGKSYRRAKRKRLTTSLRSMSASFMTSGFSDDVTCLK